MYAIQRNADGAIQYLFDTQPTFDGYMQSPVKAFDIKPETHTVVEVPEGPTLFVGGAQAYGVTGWTVLYQALYDNGLTGECERLGEKVKAQINSIHISKLYSNVTAQFPLGPKVIQFRDERDRMNVSNYSQAAMVLVMTGTPEAPMVWRTEDNEVQSLTAQQMMTIAMALLQEKQVIQTAAWAHKDAITALVDTSNLAGLRAYDVNTLWP